MLPRTQPWSQWLYAVKQHWWAVAITITLPSETDASLLREPWCHWPSHKAPLPERPQHSTWERHLAVQRQVPPRKGSQKSALRSISAKHRVVPKSLHVHPSPAACQLWASLHMAALLPHAADVRLNLPTRRSHSKSWTANSPAVCPRFAVSVASCGLPWHSSTGYLFPVMRKQRHANHYGTPWFHDCCLLWRLLIIMCDLVMIAYTSHTPMADAYASYSPWLLLMMPLIGPIVLAVPHIWWLSTKQLLRSATMMHHDCLSKSEQFWSSVEYKSPWTKASSNAEPVNCDLWDDWCHTNLLCALFPLLQDLYTCMITL